MTNLHSLDVERLRRKLQDSAVDAGGQAGSQTSLSAAASRMAGQFRSNHTSPVMLVGQLAILEFLFLLVLAGGWLFFSARQGQAPVAGQIGICLCTVLIYSLIGQLADSYQITILRRMRPSVRRSMTALLVALAIGWLATMALLPQAHPKAWLAGFSLSALAVIGLERLVLSHLLRRWTRNGLIERRAVIVGGGNPAKELIRSLESQPDNDIRICGIFDDRGGDRSPNMVAGYPKLGTVAELVEFARATPLDMLIIALPLSAEDRILQLLRKLWVLPLDIRLAAHANNLRFRPRTYSHVGDVAMLDLMDKPIRDWDSVAKRIFDLFFASLAILCLWPVMVATALAIKFTSRGPVLFVQRRHGFNNEIIDVLKFRSMYTEMSDPTARLAVTKNDPRVTPVGRFIRKTSIDELPQLFNVLRGDLSLVGPRPHAVLAQTRDKLYGDIVEGYFARHRVKPGVTGWAQINGWRGEVDTDEKIKARTACDLHYIENWSLLFDLKILFLTPIRLLNTENAY
ncbi:undecaprenyl-phosphate glucose phosphotransferase [Allorhizobium undicola]|uniref:undecaprenyl-phosphate glucose phosphotransferase n=1 Tax=Allorhizobium undicola TaxID=78527 RepID=UPI00047F42EE|nr:undecaprenyl-phosphate glucose phosphotransferase [Allorhizobium undicola]